MTPEDIFVQDIQNENCIIYEDTKYFRHLYSGRMSGIPEILKHRELENLCIQHFFENDLEHLVHKEKWQIVIYIKPESPMLRFIRKIKKILIKELL